MSYATTMDFANKKKETVKREALKKLRNQNKSKKVVITSMKMKRRFTNDFGQDIKQWAIHYKTK